MGYVILLMLALFYFIILLVGWLTHISMVKDNTDYYGWAGYRKFVEQFNKVEWRYDSNYKNSLFSLNGYDDKIHASIIMFNNSGMIINNPFTYALVVYHIRKYIKKYYPTIKKNNPNWR